MKTLEQRFNEFKASKRLWSDYIALSNAVIGKGYTFAEIKTYFNKLVHKSEYSQSDKEEIIQDLYRKTLIGQA